MPQYADEPPADAPGDLSLEKILALAKELPPLARWWLKWTCPACGERVTADTANKIYPYGIQHTEKADGSWCGRLYSGHMFGVVVEISTGED